MNWGWLDFGDDEKRLPRKERTIPNLPDDAPDEQVLDFAAIMGVKSKRIGGTEVLLKIRRAYLRKWHPDRLDE